MIIAVIKGFLATILYSYVKDGSIIWMLIVLIQFFIGLFIELPLLGFGTRKVDAELFNIKDATVTGTARNIGPGYFKFYIPRLKVPTYRYIVDGKLYVSTPTLMSNLPGYNPVAGPCTIRVKKNKPWKMISPLRHSVASILYALALGWLILPGILSLADADFQKILHPASENVTIRELMDEMKPTNDFYESDDESDDDEYWNDDWLQDLRNTSSEDSTEEFYTYESLYPSSVESE